MHVPDTKFLKNFSLNFSKTFLKRRKRHKVEKRERVLYPIYWSHNVPYVYVEYKTVLVNGAQVEEINLLIKLFT